MIKVFNAEERVFTNNGDKILNPLKAIILKEDNGDYELELETRINVINLVADMIKGGTLKLGNEFAQQGRLELYDEANALIGEMNANGLTMYAKDGSYIKINNEVGFAGYDKNGNKIYWADGDVFRTNKFVANDEVTISGRIRILPIKTGTHNGIGFVEVYEE